MPFELKQESANGIFHVKLTRDVSCDEALTLVHLAHNIVPNLIGPQPIPNPAINLSQGTTLAQAIQDGSGYVQHKLGENPVDRIEMGSYKEPDNGVRLKILSINASTRVRAIKALRDLTGISMLGSKAIIYGNYPCPILNQEVADKLLIELKVLDVHAKIVPAFGEADAA